MYDPKFNKNLEAGWNFGILVKKSASQFPKKFFEIYYLFENGFLNIF